MSICARSRERRSLPRISGPGLERNAAEALREFEAFDSEAERKRAIVRAVEKVAKHLGNTPTICRRCYIHPAVLESYLDGTMLEALADNTSKYLAENIDGLSAEEAVVAAFLRLRLNELVEKNQTGKQHRAEAGLAAAPA